MGIIEITLINHIIWEIDYKYSILHLKDFFCVK